MTVEQFWLTGMNLTFGSPRPLRFFKLKTASLESYEVDARPTRSQQNDAVFLCHVGCG